ncbi:MAG: MerR family transcriptional regulator [Balneolaceae bacterium]|nr:MerR family transcriptional regulator [Balneolaceae bacterium]
MKKLYYSIGEVSEIADVEDHVLRYWETIFKELSPKKNKAGNRVYRDKDIDTVLKLKELIQEKKYSTKGAKQALKRERQEDDGNGKAEVPTTVKKDLKEVKLFLEKLIEKL